MQNAPIVLKVGGNDLEKPGFIDLLVAVVAKSEHPVIVVHGGGKAISTMQETLGIAPQYVDGLRVSDERSLEIAEMILCGAVNTRITRTLMLYGIEAQGLNGQDRGLIRARKLDHSGGDLGRVGEPIHVRGEILLQLIAEGVTPIIAPICLGEDGPFNVNADHVAGAVGAAVNAARVLFVTNVHGVMHEGEVLKTLTEADVETLIAEGVIRGGMIPKARSALQLIHVGVREVVITDLDGLLIGAGTTFIADEHLSQQHRNGEKKNMTAIPDTLHPAIYQEQTYIAHTYGRPPFVLTHGEGMTVYDQTGKAYLDFVAGIAVMALGHSDAQISTVIQDQAAKLIHVSNLYYTEAQGQLAQALCEHSFADRVFLCNSGAEANEACIKFARKYAYHHGSAHKTEIVAFTGAFHGRTAGALSITPKAKYQDPFKPLLPNVTILPFNDIEAAKAHIGDQTCAVIVEPIQGEGGIHVASTEFLQTLRGQCNAYDAVLVFDEVQCGLGRTGALWAHSQSGVEPDLMALAKPLANGLPIGAALMTEKVHAAIQPGDHGSTFAGGSLVSAVAYHVFERLNNPAMLHHVQAMGDYLMQGLLALESTHIQAVRGRGLMLGVALDIPATDVVEAGYEAGFLLVNAGPDVLRLVPPLIVEKEHIDALLQFLSDTL